MVIFSTDIPTLFTVPSSCAADAPVYTAADIVTSSRGKTLVLPTSGVGGSSQPETSRRVTDSYLNEMVDLNSEDAKRWRNRYVLGRGVVPVLNHELELKEKASRPGILDFFPCPLKRDGLASESPEYQGILGHALGRAVDYGMQEGLAAGYDIGMLEPPTFRRRGNNPETAKDNILTRKGLLEEVDFPWPTSTVLEQALRPIYQADSMCLVAGEPLYPLLLLNVHTRKKPKVRESIDAALAVMDLDTDEDLGSVVCMPQFEDPRFEILP
ncbi:hypothetical protein Tco_0270852 [Tanacetum coccineum]